MKVLVRYGSVLKYLQMMVEGLYITKRVHLVRRAVECIFGMGLDQWTLVICNVLYVCTNMFTTAPLYPSNSLGYSSSMYGVLR